MELSSSEPKQAVELYFSCRKLKNKDLASLSDPFIVLHRKTESGWIVMGRSEIIWNNLNPDFSKSFPMDFIFERRQVFKVECRHATNKTGTESSSLGKVKP